MLFSISPNAERYLKEELWGCFKYIKIPFDTLKKMPTRDRKFYIKRHNEQASEMNNNSSPHREEAGINSFTKQTQGDIRNNMKI